MICTADAHQLRLHKTASVCHKKSFREHLRPRRSWRGGGVRGRRRQQRRLRRAVAPKLAQPWPRICPLWLPCASSFLSLPWAASPVTTKALSIRGRACAV